MFAQPNPDFHCGIIYLSEKKVGALKVDDICVKAIKCGLYLCDVIICGKCNYVNNLSEKSNTLEFI